MAPFSKMKSLTDIEECLVYNCIRKNGNEGATVKNISIDTKLPQNRMPRILKTLVVKKMIKELPVLTGNKQKIYLLFELEPSQTLAANTLFAGDAGVDGEFVAMLRTACLKYIQDKVSARSNVTSLYSAAYLFFPSSFSRLMQPLISLIRWQAGIPPTPLLRNFIVLYATLSCVP